MEENARQILNIVRGAFSGLDFDTKTRPTYCSSPQSDDEVLSCLWFEVTVGAQGENLVIGDHTMDALKEVCNLRSLSEFLLTVCQFCHQAQRIMSSTASNYNISQLFSGIAIAIVALIASLFASADYLHQAGTTGVWTILVAASYGMMMFASSFVEEEQHFWYWSASGWFAWQMIKR